MKFESGSACEDARSAELYRAPDVPTNIGELVRFPADLPVRKGVL